MIGETISHYRILSEIGAGGMGVVYRAEDLRLGRVVALKFLPPPLMQDTAARQRLFAEARAASALDHANVCTIYDVEELPDGRAFMAMAFCDGETLKQRLARGPLPPAEAVRVAAQIARGLARAHQAGIVHRDVKPANIMLTSSGEAKLLDFGIAKGHGGADLTQTGTTVGTVAYMAPEHIRGGVADAQSDVWALGVVLYEMLDGRNPFARVDDYELLRAIVDRPIPPLAAPGAGAAVQEIVARAIERDRGRRYASAAEMADALERTLAPTTSVVDAPPATASRAVTRGTMAAAVLLALLAAAGFWAWRSSGAHSVRALLPEAIRLAEQDRHGEAFLLATEAERRDPNDPLLATLWPRISQTITITSTPSGATVSFRLIGGDDDWHVLGTTPLGDTRLPRGIYRWRIEKPGFDTMDVVRGGREFSGVGLGLDVALSPSGSVPAEMVRVPVSDGLHLTITGFPYEQSYPASSYLIDRREVTNAEFKAFVDAGGYQKKEYWTEAFVENGQPLEWAAAMDRFRDRTGRPGPAGWQGGAPPPGQEQLPVTGVSWYEAAAYAAFRGKRLPTIFHWAYAARPELADAVTRTSNFESSGLKPAAEARGLGPYGTVDMAGNAKEWVSTDTGSGARYLLGGAWNAPEYQFLYPDSRSPMDRSDTNGFRCMREIDATAFASLPAALAPPSRDYTREQPASDDEYRIYAAQYAYDATPLEPRSGPADDSSPYWRHEVITIAATYGGERLPIHLFLPKNVKPPYQTVLYFPGSNAIRATTADVTGAFRAVEFIVMSGRAVALPVYKFTFDRSDPKVKSSFASPTRFYTDWIRQAVTDARRALDYLQTRADVDANALAFCGLSWGARLGA
ncbi:MAG TPA: protein kinase, partial [Vicinamibacterales bacterium]|nr:protein kinase [Vicinamibacterales bacterium]